MINNLAYKNYKYSLSSDAEMHLPSKHEQSSKSTDNLI